VNEKTDKRGWFDSDGFHAALDGVRRDRNLNWKKVAAQSGVAASTLTRMAQGKRPDVDGLAALCAWSGLDADDFVRSDEEKPQVETLAMISTYLRSDRNLSPESATALDEMVKAIYERLRKR
jgi:transcriptional regulator with XRE-family HTH domain